jgi:hypothetical protein
VTLSGSGSLKVLAEAVESCYSTHILHTLLNTFTVVEVPMFVSEPRRVREFEFP